MDCIEWRKSWDKRGIDSELTQQLLEDAELDWFARAAECFNRKYRHKYNPEDRRSKERCVPSMPARGFSFDEIYYAIDSEESEF